MVVVLMVSLKCLSSVFNHLMQSRFQFSVHFCSLLLLSCLVVGVGVVGSDCGRKSHMSRYGFSLLTLLHSRLQPPQVLLVSVSSIRLWR